jgi:hypothetical protein
MKSQTVPIMGNVGSVGPTGPLGAGGSAWKSGIVNDINELARNINSVYDNYHTLLIHDVDGFTLKCYKLVSNDAISTILFQKSFKYSLALINKTTQHIMALEQFAKEIQNGDFSEKIPSLYDMLKGNL